MMRVTCDHLTELTKLSKKLHDAPHTHILINYVLNTEIGSRVKMHCMAKEINWVCSSRSGVLNPDTYGNCVERLASSNIL